MDGWYLELSWSIIGVTVSLCPRQGGRITDTIHFFPRDVLMSGSSSQDRAREAAIELTDAIINIKPASPIKDVADDGVQSLKDLAVIFHKTVMNTGNKTTTTPSTLPQQALSKRTVEMSNVPVLTPEPAAPTVKVGGDIPKGESR